MHDGDDKQRWARLEPILDEALDLPPAGREEYLVRACGGDEALLREARRWLAASQRPGPLDRPLHEWAGDVARAATDLGGPAGERQVGPWRLLEPIGTGGMGRVFRAERVEGGFEQICALKILRWDLANESLVARFEIERQILADLDHPCIARLIDGGITDDGLPYLAMEYVEGQPIDEAVEALDLDDRLALFLEVAEAVQHAHRRLVVHRDLKPSNILVTTHGDAPGGVKLLDFGVAKILDASGVGADATQTRFAMATPLYAAPEQLQGGRVTTATDVWALGVLLHRILAGRTPFRSDNGQLTDVVRAILEREPTRPSDVAPASLRPRLRGDLDTIVGKALQKEPERRYGSVEALAADLRRQRQGLPIEARPATVGYRARKFVGRHRRSLAVTAAMLVLLVATGIFTTDRIADERDRARREARKTEQVKSFLLSLFEVNDPAISRGEDITARQLLDAGSERIPTELSGQPLIEAEMHDVVAGLYEQLGVYDRSDEHYARAAELWRERLGPRAPELAGTLARWGYTLQELGRYEEAESTLREALALQREIGSDPEDLANAANQFGMFLSYKGAYAEAESLLQASADLFERTRGADDPRRATALSNLGLTVKWAGRMDEAEPLYREALRIRRESLGDEHPDVAVTLDNLGVLQGQRGFYEESERHFREALAIRRRVLGESHPDVALNLNNLATLFRVQGRLDDAEPVYREVIATNRAALGPDHPRLATNYVNLGSVELARGEPEQAIPLFEEALRIRRLALGDGHVEVANALVHLVGALLRDDRVEEAKAPSAEAVRIARAAVDPQSPQLASALHARASVLWRDGRAGEARTAVEEALAIQDAVLAEDHWETAASRGLLGACLADLGDREAAQPLLLRSLGTLRAARGADDVLTLRTRDALVALYRATGREAAAQELLTPSPEDGSR